MKESLMRAHTGVATVGGASKGSLVTLLCGLTGTKDTSTFDPPMTRRDYSDSITFSSVVVSHRLMDASMKMSLTPSLCGHFPINEICVLRNRINGKMATVGNVCVKKFMGLPSDKIFQAVKRIREDIEKSLNTEAVEYALRRGWINQWEHEFYLSIYRKRNLTAKQRRKKIQVNRKLLTGVINARSSS